MEEHDVGAARRAFHQAVERCDANARWMNRNHGRIQGWLREKGF